MKIKNLAQLCAKAKTIALYDDGAQSWAGDGCSAYLLPESLSGINTEMLTVIFDLLPEKAADYQIQRSELPGCYDRDGASGGEELRFDLDEKVLHGGKELLPLLTAEGEAWFIQAKYIKPLADVDALRLRLVRTMGTGIPYIEAWDGMFLAGFIMPIKVKSALCEWLSDVYNGAAKTLRFSATGEVDDDAL